MLLLMALVVGTAIAVGIWRRFGPIQWIWLLAGLSFAMLILWALLLIFVIGPGMRATPMPNGMP
jgi:hypothetical protein